MIEPRIDYIFQRKEKRKHLPAYIPRSEDDVTDCLVKFLTAKGFNDIKISHISRMTGGASKEQFAFDFSHAAEATSQRYVLRMDPLEGIVETCRLREAEVLQALEGLIPVPKVLGVDAEGDYLGLPGIITHFVGGVTKPTSSSSQSVSGVGSSYGEYTSILAPQFVKYLVEIHTFSNFNPERLPNFVIPTPNTPEAALYQVNAWAKSWSLDMIEPIPLITLTEQWLRMHAPVCESPCLVHCDYRIGNFMFEEPSGDITTILDWELAHFGDFHEDLAWILQKLFGSTDKEGNFLVCGLMKREDFIDEYEKSSGRRINLKTLRYYEILNAWKCAIMDLGTALTAAKNSHNHQDLLITWLGSAGAVFLNQIQKLLKEDYYAS